MGDIVIVNGYFGDYGVVIIVVCGDLVLVMEVKSDI